MGNSFDVKSQFHTCAMFILGGLICLLRNRLVFLHPIAGWEDGTQGINIYGQVGAPLFHMYSGYVQAWPNLIYRVVMFALPLPWVPYAFSLTALAITGMIVPATFHFMRHATKLDRMSATICAIIVGIVPTGDWLMMSNIDYAIWPIAAILILCLWNPIPNPITGKCFYVGWRALAVATNPLALPAALVWVVFTLRAERRSARFVYGLLALATLIYAVFGVDHQPAAVSQLVPAAAQALRLATQSSLLALFPGGALLGHWPPLWLLSIILCAALVAIAAIRHRLVEIVIFTVGLGAICMICALGRGVQHSAAYLFDQDRYSYVPRLLWCCLIAAALADLWRRHEGAPARLGIAVGCTVLLTVQLSGLARSYAWNDLPTSDRLLAFLAEADDRLKAGQKGPFMLVREDRFGVWSIVIGGARKQTP